jgi:hypothetical protein
VLYPWHSAAPRTFGLSPIDDQILGGLLMGCLQSVDVSRSGVLPVGEESQ